MIRQERGFSLVELMITIVIFIMVIAASSQVFTALLTQFKQQSKIGETDIEGAIGLDILRRDLAHAGFGLPGDLNGVNYLEATDAWTAFNDAPNNPPRAVAVGAGAGINGSVLIIKGTNLAVNNACQRWTYISNRGALPNMLKSWGTGAGSQDNFQPGDRVVVMKPNPDPNNRVNILQKSATGFWTTFARDISNMDAAFQPLANSYESFVMYGIDQDSALRMPFNRADYYVRRPTTIPQRCAPNTGVLYKATVNHSDGSHTELLPVLDCVADMRVRFCLNTGGVFAIDDGTVVNTLTAAQLRDRLQDIQVYIVAQEGQRDNSYDFSNNGVRVGFSPQAFCGSAASQTVNTANLSTLVGDPDYKQFRWRLYTIVARPISLR